MTEGRAVLRCVVSVGFDGARDLQSQVLKLRAQGYPGNSKELGSPALIAAGVLQDAGEQEPIQLPVDLRMQIASVAAEPLA
jgi:hypothetical protein